MDDKWFRDLLTNSQQAVNRLQDRARTTQKAAVRAATAMGRADVARHLIEQANLQDESLLLEALIHNHPDMAQVLQPDQIDGRTIVETWQHCRDQGYPPDCVVGFFENEASRSAIRSITDGSMGTLFKSETLSDLRALIDFVVDCRRHSPGWYQTLTDRLSGLTDHSTTDHPLGALTRNARSDNALFNLLEDDPGRISDYIELGVIQPYDVSTGNLCEVLNDKAVLKRPETFQSLLCPVQRRRDCRSVVTDVFRRVEHTAPMTARAALDHVRRQGWLNDDLRGQIVQELIDSNARTRKAELLKIWYEQGGSMSDRTAQNGGTEQNRPNALKELFSNQHRDEVTDMADLMVVRDEQVEVDSILRALTRANPPHPEAFVHLVTEHDPDGPDGLFEQMLSRSMQRGLCERIDGLVEVYGEGRAAPELFVEAATNEDKREALGCSEPYHMLKKLFEANLRPERPADFYEAVGEELTDPMNIHEGYESIINVAMTYRVVPDTDWLSRYEQDEPRLASTIKKHLPQRARRMHEQRPRRQ